MKKSYDLAVKTGTYEKGGETKGRYENIGAVLEGDDGPFIMLKRTFNPAGAPFRDGKDSILVSMFKPKEHGSAPAPDRSAADEEDIPY